MLQSPKGVGERAAVRRTERIRGKVDGSSEPTVERTTTLDVREIPPVERHSTIHDAFVELEPSETFTIVNDHEPKPQFYEFQPEIDAFDIGDDVGRKEPNEFVAEFPKRTDDRGVCRGSGRDSSERRHRRSGWAG